MISSRVLIIVSQKDIAGMNMLSYFLENENFAEQSISIPTTWPNGVYLFYEQDGLAILVIPEFQIYSDYFSEGIDTELMIFASKHSSAARQKALLVHTTGLWGEESGHGGRSHELAIAPSYALTKAYHLIKRYQTDNLLLSEYWVGIEATHHGPTNLPFPIMFVETGGTIEEWEDKAACDLIARVILEVSFLHLKDKLDEEYANIPTLIGFGGGHYCPSFIKRLESGEYTLGHIAPKYTHEFLTHELVLQSWEKTKSMNKIFLIDKKGTKSTERKNIISIIEKLNLTWKYSGK